MSRPQPRSQEKVFYVGGWTYEIERAVLMKLEFEQWSGNWVVGDTGNNKQCLRLVRQDVNEEMGVDIPIDLYFAKLNEWIQRTNHFGGLIARPNFQYDIATNTVKAPDSVWIDIERRRPELLVYMERGEECWSQLRSLFRQLIDLSSSSSSAKQQSRSGQTRPIEISSRSTYPQHAANRPDIARISDGSDSQCESDVVDKP
ncbi:hypothetical protein C2S51_038643 [Perilla frutescens var. frutescens]|nr:hypothetical protein C2S51_038643 [Perilla frutescens var. frutescens]